MPVPLVEFRNVTKRFGALTVLDGVNLSIYEGDVTTIIGKSGIGKSVLLKHIIGLLEPDAGKIFFRGTWIGDMKRSERKALKRQISYMFQNNALFDSLTVFENVALPLKEKTRLSNEEIKEKVAEKIKRLELAEVTSKYPSQISGGMKKRVALARALVTDPSIVLFDEPTTGLDPLRKNAVLGMLHHYQKQFGFTAVIVSHNIPDILFISNKVAIIDGGRIIFQGTPLELEQSDNTVIQQFISGLESLKDELTGLETKRNIDRRLAFEMDRLERSGERFSVILFTIEHFEQIDEHVGYIAAQQIIQSLADLIKKHIGPEGVAARYSRNQILILLPRTTASEAELHLKEFNKELKRLDIFRRENYRAACLNFSILKGLSEAEPGVDLDSLLQRVKAHQETIARLDCGKHREKA